MGAPASGPHPIVHSQTCYSDTGIGYLSDMETTIWAAPGLPSLYDRLTPTQKRRTGVSSLDASQESSTGLIQGCSPLALLTFVIINIVITIEVSLTYDSILVSGVQYIDSTIPYLALTTGVVATAVLSWMILCCGG